MNENVTLIPARRRAGNRISKEENNEYEEPDDSPTMQM